MILDGTTLAKKRNQVLKSQISALDSKLRKPHLAIINIGSNKASEIYIKHKIKQANQVGIKATLFSYDENIDEKVLEENIIKINSDASVDGIIIQLPLPPKFNQARYLDLISYQKDVDGFSVIHQGYLFQGRERILSATPLGIINLLDYYKIDVSGMNCLIIGASLIVGLPISRILLERGATIQVAHKLTKNLKSLTKKADLIIVAVGKPNLITKDMVSKKAIIIDVGINRLENNKIVGDSDYPNLYKKVSCITPVPGGVGPMTVNALLENVFTVYKKYYLKED